MQDNFHCCLKDGLSLLHSSHTLHSSGGISKHTFIKQLLILPAACSSASNSLM